MLNTLNSRDFMPKAVIFHPYIFFSIIRINRRTTPKDVDVYSSKFNTIRLISALGCLKFTNHAMERVIGDAGIFLT